jgi:tight adherence protein C
MMGSNFLLFLGIASIGLALATVVLAAGWGAGQATGVARSLAIIEQTVDPHEVSKQDMPMSERLVQPMLLRTRGLAFKLSPAGASDRMTRLLDLAGNPGNWTAEKIMGFKGAGLLGGGVLGLLLGGLGLKGLLFALAGAAAGFYIPDLLLYNMGLKRQEELRLGRLSRWT